MNAATSFLPRYGKGKLQLWQRRRYGSFCGHGGGGDMKRRRKEEGEDVFQVVGSPPGMGLIFIFIVSLCRYLGTYLGTTPPAAI